MKQYRYLGRRDNVKKWGVREGKRKNGKRKKGNEREKEKE